MQPPTQPERAAITAVARQVTAVTGQPAPSKVIVLRFIRTFTTPSETVGSPRANVSADVRLSLAAEKLAGYMKFLAANDYPAVLARKPAGGAAEELGSRYRALCGLEVYGNTGHKLPVLYISAARCRFGQLLTEFGIDQLKAWWDHCSPTCPPLPCSAVLNGTGCAAEAGAQHVEKIQDCADFCLLPVHRHSHRLSPASYETSS